MIVDADGVVLGRAASVIAKRLLMGEEVVVINAEKAVISGKEGVVKARFLGKRSRTDPIRGPFYPKYPHMVFKRVVRGMLPYKNQRGSEALKRLKVVVGDNGMKGEKIGKTSQDLRAKYVTLGSLCESLGAKKRW